MQLIYRISHLIWFMYSLVLYFLLCVIFLETGSHHVAQAELKLLIPLPLHVMLGL